MKYKQKQKTKTNKTLHTLSTTPQLLTFPFTYQTILPTFSNTYQTKTKNENKKQKTKNKHLTYFHLHQTFFTKYSHSKKHNIQHNHIYTYPL